MTAIFGIVCVNKNAIRGLYYKNGLEL